VEQVDVAGEVDVEDYDGDQDQASGFQAEGLGGGWVGFGFWIHLGILNLFGARLAALDRVGTATLGRLVLTDPKPRPTEAELCSADGRGGRPHVDWARLPVGDATLALGSHVFLYVVQSDA
jgi:hypothetical protein